MVLVPDRYVQINKGTDAKAPRGVELLVAFSRWSRLGSFQVSGGLVLEYLEYTIIYSNRLEYSIRYYKIRSYYYHIISTEGSGLNFGGGSWLVQATLASFLVSASAANHQKRAESPKRRLGFPMPF